MFNGCNLGESVLLMILKRWCWLSKATPRLLEDCVVSQNGSQALNSPRVCVVKCV